MHELSIERIRSARDFLQGRVSRTPLVALPRSGTRSAQKLLIKAENLQVSGSFKIRGATNYLGALDRARYPNGVIAYSTGNHGKAVATAANLMGIAATVVMSSDVPEHKIAAVECEGARVVMAPPNSLHRREMAERLAIEEGLALLPPCDDYNVLAGQASVAIEIMESCTPNAIFVPVGGGGLLSATAVAVKQIVGKGVRVIGAEPELEDDTFRSYHTKQRVVLEKSSESIADAVRIRTPGKLTLPLIERYVDDVVTVTETEIAQAVLDVATDAHLVLEPSGALAVAAARTYLAKQADQDVVVAIGSGGNTPIEALNSLAQIAKRD